MVRILPSLNLGCWDTALAKAVLLLRYMAGLRVGELVVSTEGLQHTLMYSNLYAVYLDGQVSQFVFKMETYKHSNRQIKWVRVHRRQGSQMCPVQALINYLQYRGDSPGLIFMHQNGKLVLASWVLTIIRKLVGALGLDPASYATHSLRIGATTDLANQGATEHQLQ